MDVPSAPTADRSEFEQGPEERGPWDIFLDLMLPAASELRGLLSIDEEMFRMQSFRASPRDFAIWSALDEIEKTAMTLMRLESLLEDDAAETDQVNSVGRTSLAMLTEEIHLRARRLAELLVQLVLSGTTNEEIYYRHFLLLRELEGGTRFNADLKEFYEHQSEWVQTTLSNTIAEIRALEPSIEFQRAWYLESKNPLDQDNPRSLMATARTQFVGAIPLMTDFERMAMGGSYGEAFGQPSTSLHFAPGMLTPRLTKQTVHAEASRIGFLSFCVIRRCRQILNATAEDYGAKIDRALNSNTEALRMHDRVHYGPHIDVGDFVLARGCLGQAVEETISKYGYRHLRIELLAERPQPNLAEDWFRPRDLTLLHAAEKIRERVAQLTGCAPRDVDVVTLRSSMVDAWNAGLRDEVRRRR